MKFPYHMGPHILSHIPSNRPHFSRSEAQLESTEKQLRRQLKQRRRKRRDSRGSEDGTAPEMQMAGKWVIFQVMTGKNTRDYQGESMDMPFNGKFGAEIDGFNRVYPNFLYGF